MRIRTYFAAAVILCAINPASSPARSPAGDPASDPAAGLDSLAWITGSWGTDGAVVEYWTPPRGGLMIGLNRPLDDGAKPFFEYLRIEQRADGVFYVAQPMGRPSTSFRLVKQGEHSAVFENLEHDFPQRLAYRLEGDTLIADVTASQEGEWTGFTLRWQRLPHTDRPSAGTPAD